MMTGERKIIIVQKIPDEDIDMYRRSSLAKEFSAPAEKKPEEKKPANANGEGMDQFVKILPMKYPEEVLNEIDQLVGMEDFKKNARKLVFLSKFNKARGAKGLSKTKMSLHTAFLGNPGTGKTTVARLQAELLYSLNMGGSRYVEISRENMVGKYIGETEKRMVELLNTADYVFIDEAYNLVSDKSDKKDFGNRVVDALMTALENKRDSLTVFFAGYPEEMKAFIKSNPGLSSRISHYQTMPDYTVPELGQIMDLYISRMELNIEPEARAYLLDKLEEMKKKTGERDFGNARIVRNLVEKFPEQIAERLFGENDADAVSFEKDDLQAVTLTDAKKINFAGIFGETASTVSNRMSFGGTQAKFAATM